jgi:predicted aconitase
VQLTQEEKAILAGSEGPVMAKVMKTLVMYGEALKAERLVELEGPGHFSIPFSMPGVGPRMEMLAELAEAGCRAEHGFTLDPRPPFDYENLFVNREQAEAFPQVFARQDQYDKYMQDLGLMGERAYTCTPYFDEVGNIPTKGTVLAWSESSCVVYVNSVLGARTNRNAAIMDILSNLAGRTPLSGLLTDEGRKAGWLIEVKCKHMPNPRLLGSAVGMKVMDGIPYITGLDRFLDPAMSQATIDFLKEFGAACAAIGAVGLFHIEGITPEVVESGPDLLSENPQSFVIDDAYLERMFAAYPVMWADKNAKPQKCFIGCPHLSFDELNWWSRNISRTLQEQDRDKLAVPTVFCAAPQVLDRFRQSSPDACQGLLDAGAALSGTCPEAYMSNGLCSSEAVITNSNKMRAFTPARMFLDHDLLQVIVSGEIPGEV